MNYDSKRFRSSKRLISTMSLMVALGLSACGGDGSSSGGTTSVTGGGGSGGYGGGTTSAPTIASLAFSNGSPTVGTSTTLSWSVTGATSCTSSGSWTGSRAESGTFVVTPSTPGTYTYTLSCTDAGGTASKSATLTVDAAAAGPYVLTQLVADAPGAGVSTLDTHLATPWGISFAADAPVWVANFASQTSTLYDGDGKAQPVTAPLVVKLAPGASGQFFPTGIVANATSDFSVSEGTKSGAASFIYVGEGGMVAGWSSSVDTTNAITAYADTGGAAYTGVTLAQNAGQNFLYAADFHNAKIDVFNGTFVKQTPSATSFTFSDPTLPKGYAPFGIQALATGQDGATQIYVTYAQQPATAGQLPATGAGLGLVDVFDTNGQLVTHLIPAGGSLNAPWGIALAPADFGALSNDLLIGNFGDGHINAFDVASGMRVGAVSDADNNPIAVSSLWGIAFGNGSGNQPLDTLFFAASANGGEYGRIDVGATAPVLNAKPVVTLSTPAATVGGTVTLTAQVTDPLTVSQVQFFAGATSIGTATTTPFSVAWNTTTATAGSVSLTATATDADGNVGTSPAVAVTVSNGAAPATLTQLQAEIFGPICSVCHNGIGTSLPGVQDLTSAAATFKSLVGVPSIEQPSVERVNPGDPDASYVVLKLEGAPSISGARMPFGGPYLSAAQIAQVESWISAGALDN
jgi:uncharacterized protein (TIGR03118 family)